MASSNPNADKTMAAYAMSSNSILQKIENLTTQSTASLSAIEKVISSSVSTTRGLAAAISENTKILREIKSVLQGKEDSKKKLNTSIDMSKLAGAAGLIAVAGFGIFTLSMAFQATDAVKPAQILKGIAIMAALVPMAKVISELLADSGGIFSLALSSPRIIFNLATVVIGLATMTYVMGMAIASIPAVGGPQILTLLAISTAIYIQGKIFIGLIKAWEFSGFINKYLNRNNTTQIMEALTVMTINTVIIAVAMSAMPSVKPMDAVAFVIATTALIPMAAALIVVRFALPALRGLDKGSVLKFGGMVMVMAAALIPVALAAKAVGKINITDKEIETMNQLIKVMAPIGIIIAFMGAIINLQREQTITNRGGGAGNFITNRGRSARIRLREIRNFAVKGVAIIMLLGLMAVAAKYAMPMLKQGVNSMNGIDTSGLIQFILVTGIAMLLFGGAIAMVMRAMKGGSSSYSSGFLGFGSKQKRRSGKITGKDILAMTLIIPAIIIGIGMAAIAWAFMPDKFPEIKDPGGFLLFTLLAGLAVNIFASAIGKIARGIRRMRPKQIPMIALIIPIIALGIVAAAYIFQLLPDKFKAPDAEWSLKVGLPLLTFGVLLYLSNKMFGARMHLKTIAKATRAVIASAGLAFVVAWIFSGLPGTFKSPPLRWVMLSTPTLLLFATAIYFSGKLWHANTKTKTMLKATRATIISALLTVAVAWIFQLLPGTFVAPPMEWLGKTAAAVLGMGAALWISSKTFGTMKKDQLIKGLIAVAVAAATVFVIAWIFTYLPDASEMKSPEMSWTGNTALGILVFGGLLYLGQKAGFHRMDLISLGKLFLVFIASAILIVIVAHIFRALPGELTIPLTEKEAIAMAAVLGGVGLAMVGVGKLLSKGGAANGAIAIGLGLLGIIAAALGILIAGWILSGLAGAMPKLKVVAQGFVDIVMMPLNSMVNLFKKVNDDIGVDNLVPLSLGIAAMGGAMIVLGLGAAAMGAGGAYGGVAAFFGSIADAGSSAIRGKEVDNSPLGILMVLLANSSKIMELANSMSAVGNSLKLFNNIDGAITKMVYNIGSMMATDPNTFKSNALAFSGVSGSFVTIAVASNKMNVKAIEATTLMFKALNDLVYNKPESTLQIFAQQLMVAVKELSEAVAELERVNLAGNNNLGDQLGNFVGNINDKIFGKAEEVKEKAKELEKAGAAEKVDMTPVVQAIQNLEDRFERAINIVDVTEPT